MGGLFMKLGRLLAFILSSAVSGCVCTPVQYSSAESAKYLLGDVDGDGKVSSVDASAVLAEYAAISGGNEPAFSEVQFRAADITRDGKTDSVDASQILSYYAYLSTGGTLIMEDFLAQPPVTTTATTNSATTTIVTTTTSVTTSVPVSTSFIPYQQRQYKIEDITSDDAFVARWAMQQYAEELNNELFNGYYFDTQYGRSDGFDECFALIATLNYNQGINHRALGNRFGYESEDYYLRCTDCLNIAYYQFFYESKVDFNKYVLDKNFANFINKVSDEFAEYKKGNKEPLTNELNEYFANNTEHIDNYTKYYFMCNTAHPQDYFCDEMIKARKRFNDNVANKMRDDFMQYGGKLK
jgi:hypothetical protein